MTAGTSGPGAGRGCVVWLLPGLGRDDDVLTRAVRAWGGAPAQWTLQRWCGACRASGHGQPVLPWPGAPAASVSYTDGLAAVALADAPAVGIDIERRVPRPGLEALASYVWSDAERAAVQADPVAALYRDWARKEAVLKAHAVGLSVPMWTFPASERVELPGRRPLVVRDLTASGCDDVAMALAVPPGVSVEVRVAAPLRAAQTS